MASKADDEVIAAAPEMQQKEHESTPVEAQSQQQTNPPDQVVEMAQVSPLQHEASATAPTTDTAPDAPATVPTVDSSTPIEPTHSPESSNAPVLARSETAEFALGPDGAALPTVQADSPEPVLRITLMLTTGARHPYLISSKYLAARKVQAVDTEGNFDPREMSAYKLKELIWTDWRQEWEPKPRDPAAIRLIILGRMLDDKSQLKESPFSLTAPNVVHMTVKPADLMDDEAEGAGKSITKSPRDRGSSEGESAGCCRCVVQ